MHIMITTHTGDEKPKPKDYHQILTSYCTEWMSIGLQLNLEQSALNLMSADHPNDNRECFRLVLEKWLDMDIEATWSTLELAITNARRQKLGLKPLNASKAIYNMTHLFVVTIIL